MTKRTHKFKGLGDASAVIARSTSVLAAARALGVDPSTIHRWIAAGKAPRPAGGTRRPRQQPAIPPQTPASWAQWARDTFDLTPGELALVDLAERALALARDDAAKPETRLAAMGRFQALVKQLDFEVIDDGKTEATSTPGPWPRRVG